MSLSRAVVWCLCVALVIGAAATPTTAQPVIGATVEELRLEAPRPYGTPWQTTIQRPGASYIAIHFASFSLAPGDRLELSDPEGRYHHVYTGLGYKDRGGDFWALSILGDTMIVTLHAQQSLDPDGGERFGLVIDRLAHGFPEQLPEPDAICGTRDDRDLECYRSSHPTEFAKARAAVRLIKNGAAHCTGWLASCQNHIVTNQHCVATQSELDQIEFQFDYKKPACGSGTATTALQLQGGTLLEVDAPLDYALIMPSLAGNDPQATFGYLQWDKDRLPALDEKIYIPGHPNGEPKTIALTSTDTTHDPTGRCEIWSVSEPACATSGPPDVGYYCDTQGGSSGSPVLSASTHKVVALHHCANCPNRGVPIREVFADIQASAHPLPGCSVCDPGPATGVLTSSVPGPNRIDLAWGAAPGAASYRIYRSTAGCDTALAPIATVTTTSYQDTAVSGGRTYSYRVVAVNSCGAESARSNCSTQTATGNCVDAPLFAGLSSATNARSTSCAVDLAWSAASPQCGSTVRYNVYRSLLPGTPPSAATLVASCLTATSWHDATVENGIAYHYVVRAEDNVTTGGGPCGGGNQETNLMERPSTPSGPDSVYFSTGFESAAGWTLEGEWQIAAPQARGGSAAGGSGAADPATAFAGAGVLGTDLTGLGGSLGNYEDSITTMQFATSPAINGSGHSQALVRYRRWLGVEKNSYDLAQAEVFNGSIWSTLWGNPNVDVNDGAWTLQEFDATSQLAGRNTGRLRFGIRSDSSVKFCGWNVDALEVYEPGVCSSAASAVHPVADGKWSPGAPMTARKSTSNAPNDVVVTWDVASCPVEFYALLHGSSDDLASYGYAGAACGLSASGTATVPIPLPAPGKATWWVLVGTSGTVESNHGRRSTGALRSGSAGGLCGLFTQNSAATCP